LEILHHMNLLDIKNLISEVGKVVFVEGDKVVGVFLSYEEYLKMVAQKNEQCPASSLPLFTPKEAPAKPACPASPMIMSEVFEDEPTEILPEEPEVIITASPAESFGSEVKPVEIKQEKELSIDDLPF